MKPNSMKPFLFSLVSPFLFLVSISLGDTRPNILFCISDDQSYAHTGANGDPVNQDPSLRPHRQRGPAFHQRLLRCTHLRPLSQCHPHRPSPSGALKRPATFTAPCPPNSQPIPKSWQKSGYQLGYTGKAWSPGRLEAGGRNAKIPPARAFDRKKLKPPYHGIRNTDYAGNFEDFLAKTSDEKPFCFWLGTSEPHRHYQEGIGKAERKGSRQGRGAPRSFPDHDIVRNDLLDYYVEIEHFDKMVAQAIIALEKSGQLDNTIVVVTSDHGMPFPRAKASLYDAGSRVPLAIRWPGGIKKPGRDVSAFRQSQRRGSHLSRSGRAAGTEDDERTQPDRSFCRAGNT